ncbi:MAG TPA: glycosyltransferase family 9 protein [Kiritimatiellae bacterium]|nr:glycosyltransferase family 9 protein [Kiritimatiellia bacterium]
MRNAGEALAYRIALWWLGGPRCPATGRGVEARRDGAAAATLVRRSRMSRDGLASVRQVWWDQVRLEPYLTTWRYVLLLEAVEQWNMCEAEEGGSGESQGGILVVQLEHLGNLIHTIPLIRALQDRFSAIPIHLLVGPWCADLARRIGGVEEVIVYAPRTLQLNRGDRRSCLSWGDELKFLRSLRMRRYRLLVSCGPGNLVDRLLIQAVRPGRWLGARKAGDIYPEWCAASPVRYDSRKWEAVRLLSLAGPGERPGRAAASLSFPLDEESRRFGRETAAAARKRVGPQAALVVIAPGAGWPGRVWPAEYYVELVSALEQVGAAVVLVGGRDTFRRAREIARRAPVALNLAARTTLVQAAGIIAAAEVFVGSDSGLLHVAAALGVSAVGLYGPIRPLQWALRGPAHLALYHPVSCGGCQSWHPRSRCRDDRACMRAISPAEVLAGVRELLDVRRRGRRPAAGD